MSQSERHAPGHALVVGGGTMGVGIIAMFLGGGWKVDVVSRSASTRDGLPEACKGALAALGKPTDTSGLVTYATLPEASWKTIDVVVETVTEDLELKRHLFAEMEKLAQPGCAITSNSSSFPISEIAKDLATQGRMMGLHFFMPAHLIPLVEVVRSVHTDVAEAERVGEIMRSLGKRPVQVKKDVIGFLGNRIQGALMREALWLIEQGGRSIRAGTRPAPLPRSSGPTSPTPTARRRSCSATSTRAASASRPSAASSSGTTSRSPRNGRATSTRCASAWRSSRKKAFCRFVS